MTSGNNVASVTQVADVTDVIQVTSVTEVTSVRSCSLVRSVLFGSCNPQAIMLTHLRWLDPATPRKYQSRHKCPKGVLKICEQAPIFNLAFCTFGVRPLLRSAQSQRSVVRPATYATCVTFDTLCHIFCHCHTVTHPCGNVSCGISAVSR